MRHRTYVSVQPNEVPIHGSRRRPLTRVKPKMIKPLSFSLLLLSHLQTLTFTLAIAVPSLNISRFLFPRIGHELRPQQSHFLQDVLNTISEKQNWNSEDVKISKLDLGKVSFGSSQRYEFRFGIGKSEFLFKLRDEVSSWKRLKKEGDFESIVKQVSSVAVLDTLQIEGPFELQVNGSDELSLLLPMNTTHTSLKRILVGEGITLEVSGVQQVSLFHASKFGLQVNKSAVVIVEKSDFWSIGPLLCTPLLPIRVSGSASVNAYKTQNPDAYLKTALLSSDTIELLPEKCYPRNMYKKRSCPINSLRLRIVLLEKLMRTFFGDKIRQNADTGFLKAKAIASTVVRFQLELERNIGSNDNLEGTLAEWRTRPSVERVCFEVVARIEGESLKPLVMKKVRPFIVVDSSAWSNLMSNISFTKFPSILVPPESLTLDVKW